MQRQSKGQGPALSALPEGRVGGGSTVLEQGACSCCPWKDEIVTFCIPPCSCSAAKLLSNPCWRGAAPSLNGSGAASLLSPWPCLAPQPLGDGKVRIQMQPWVWEMSLSRGMAGDVFAQALLWQGSKLVLGTLLAL